MKPKISRLLLPLLASLCFGAVGASAAVIISGPTTYQQNFDSVFGPTEDKAWVNNCTIPGWYLGERDPVNSPFWDGTVSPDSGLAGGNDWYHLGSTTDFGSAPVTDRALGQYNFNNPIRLGKMALQFRNTTGADASLGSVSFTVEQWRDETATAGGGMRFYYIVSANQDVGFNEDVTGWTEVGSLGIDYNGLGRDTGAGRLDGNLAANSDDLAHTFAGTGVTVGDNQYLTLAWRARAGNARDTWAIDDLTVEIDAIPEPGAASLLSALGLVILFRRSRRDTAA